MRVALVHDALINRGGAERVFQIFCEMFPEAPVYTSVYFPNKTYPYFKKRQIHTTPLQNLVSNEMQFKSLFPLANYFMQTTKIKNCDIILSSSTYCGKYVNEKNSKHICYCHQPFRLLWAPESYFNKGSMDYKQVILKKVTPLLKKWDYSAMQNVDVIISNSVVTQKRVKRFYNRDSIILHPPINNKKFSCTTSDSDYFLVISRLEPYKNVDLVVKVFNELELPIKIVGSGSLAKQLKSVAKNNIEFYHHVSDIDLIEMYQKCKAVVFPQKEDFGLVPLEANACGKPVICYGYGGIETTMIPYTDQTRDTATALFFYEQTADKLIDTIKEFETITFKKEALLINSKKFDIKKFQNRLDNIVASVCNTTF